MELKRASYEMVSSADSGASEVQRRRQWSRAQTRQDLVEGGRELGREEGKIELYVMGIQDLMQINMI